MDPNHGTPTGCGRGRPVDVQELRRPHIYSTFPEFIPPEGTNTNGMYSDPQWHDQVNRGKCILDI